MTVRQYWIAYDISEDRERTRVERCLLRYGQRIQKSVFCCVLNTQRRMRLQGELEALACQSGSIIWVALADPSEAMRFGQAGAALHEDWAFVYPDKP